jgi:hypothetical protein
LDQIYFKSFLQSHLYEKYKKEVSINCLYLSRKSSIHNEITNNDAINLKNESTSQINSDISLDTRNLDEHNDDSDDDENGNDINDDDDVWSLNDPNRNKMRRATKEYKKSAKYIFDRIVGGIIPSKKISIHNESLSRVIAASANSQFSEEQLAEQVAAMLVNDVIRENNQNQ